MVYKITPKIVNIESLKHNNNDVNICTDWYNALKNDWPNTVEEGKQKLDNVDISINE